jgi:hypothetical protein
VVRLVLEFLGDASDQRWPPVERALAEAGAQSIGTPSGTPPHLVTAVLPADADVDATVDRLTRLDGVGRAEPDAMRETFGPT